MGVIDKVFTSIDPYTSEETSHIQVGEKIASFELSLSSSQRVDLSTVLKNTPVLLHFIRGTWCPYCRAHLKQVNEWSKQRRHNITSIIISDEPRDTLQAWKMKMGYSWLFASDPNKEIIKRFGLDYTEHECQNQHYF